ncbi:metallophosphoesterase [Cellulophaga algicola DSM 14237]|uniref:Metallophosphoesterase n=1 Tax=Cellulophaga algicola (strain DSM 14237 / IC166 / ACAM 630) TaxID=688270 RepID=E6X6A7_CELAD|nr:MULTISPECIES: metallophosphoesterase [Cellulophaga]ADV47407.1 metallophosphoesterase [Cellulophaga algicola DSM 14237]
MHIKRRVFIKHLFLGLLGLTGLIYLDSFWIEKYIIDWNTHDLSDATKNKIKIIQLSDLHLKEIVYFHKTIAEKINKEKPDFIVFTGDTISRRNTYHILEQLLDLMDPNILKIAILGNKEYDARVDIATFKSTFKKYNGMVLINEHYVFKKAKRAINVIGVDDLLRGDADFKKSIQQLDKTLETIVLNHCPAYTDIIDALNTKEKLPIKFVLSGHTHGGQITFFGIPLYTPGGSGDYIKGWYTKLTTKMYVSKGIGTTVLPIRFFARAEASIFYI